MVLSADDSAVKETNAMNYSVDIKREERRKKEDDRKDEKSESVTKDRVGETGKGRSTESRQGTMPEPQQSRETRALFSQNPTTVSQTGARIVPHSLRRGELGRVLATQCRQQQPPDGRHVVVASAEML